MGNHGPFSFAVTNRLWIIESLGVFSMVGAREVESCEAEKLKFGEIAPESSGKSQLKICSYDLPMFRGS